MTSQIVKRLFLSVAFSFFLLLISIKFHSYLSFNNPISADILLVEGWINSDYVPAILEELHRHHYSRIVVIGTIKPKINEKNIEDTKANAFLITKKLRTLSNNVIVINSINSVYKKKHQTFNYMVFFKNWLTQEHPNIKSVDLFSVGVHARKSHLLLRRVLPSSIETGVISAAPIYYNSECWWLSKKGIRLFLKNTISFFYALFFENCHSLAC